jgi:hypothetical protein
MRDGFYFDGFSLTTLKSQLKGKHKWLSDKPPTDNPPTLKQSINNPPNDNPPNTYKRQSADTTICRQFL